MKERLEKFNNNDKNNDNNNRMNLMIKSMIE